MPFVEKEYQFTTIGQIIELWTTNADFKEFVGPTVVHIVKLLDNNSFNRFVNNTGAVVCKKGHITLEYDQTNDIELFICSPSKLSNELKYKYESDYIKLFWQNGYCDYQNILNDNYLLKYGIANVGRYIIDNKIRLDNCPESMRLSLLANNTTSQINMLIDLGCPFTKNELRESINYYNNKDMFTTIAMAKKFGFDNCLHIMENMVSKNNSSLENIYTVFAPFKDDDTMWNVPETQYILEKFKYIKNIRHTLVDKYTFLANYYVKDGVIQYKSGEFTKHIMEIVKKEKLDINRKVSNGSYLIQFFVQETKTDSVIELLDMGAKLFDDDGLLLKGVENRNIVEFTKNICGVTTYKYTYDILTNYYKDNEDMLNKINFAYKEYLTEKTTESQQQQTCFIIKIMERVKEEVKLDDNIQSIYDQITDQALKDKLLAYHAKQLSKNKK